VSYLFTFYYFFRAASLVGIISKRVNQARNQHEEGSRQSLLLGLIFNLEDGSDVPPKYGFICIDYMALYTGRYNSSEYICDFRIDLKIEIFPLNDINR
jgi:hypothetical protein